MKHIVVIGGGYAGLQVAKDLKKKRAQVTLVDKTPYHYWQVRIHEYISGSIKDNAIVSSLLQSCLDNKIKFVQDKATHIDQDKQEVALAGGSVLEYDYLILAQGAKTSLFDKIKGLSTYALDIKQFDHSSKYKAQFSSLLKQAKKSQGTYRIVVAGAGLSGVEIILEMSTRANKKQLGEHFEFTIIEPMETVLPGMHPYLIKESTKIIEKHNVKMVQAFVDEVEKDTIHLSNQTKMPYDMLVFTAGIQAHIIPSTKEMEHNQTKQLLVNEYMQVKGCDNIFAIGDCAENSSGGEYSPPTGQIAVINAKYVAENINKLLKDKPMTVTKQTTKGMVIALGGTDAIGRSYGLNLKGTMAYIAKKLSFMIAK